MREGMQTSSENVINDETNLKTPKTEDQIYFMTLYRICQIWKWSDLDWLTNVLR